MCLCVALLLLFPMEIFLFSVQTIPKKGGEVINLSLFSSLPLPLSRAFLPENEVAFCTEGFFVP